MKWELKINNILIIPQTMNEDFQDFYNMKARN